MRVVIDIPRDQYGLIMQSHRNGVERYISKETMMYAIQNGIPLPKGHGRLKDENEIKQMIDGAKVENESSKIFAENIIIFAPTIIEADIETTL